MNGMKPWIIALALLACAGVQAQQLYRWVDKDGGVHYTQQPPPVDAKDVQRKNVSAGPAEYSGLPYAAQLAIRNYPVTLYSSPDCGQACKDARESLQKRGVPFNEVVVADEASLQELKRVSGKDQVPALRVGSQTTVGFQADAWKSALDIAGYPASIPAARPQAPAAPKELPPVMLYTSEQCGGLCDEARRLLTARGVKFQETTVSPDDPATIEELIRVSGGDTLPVLAVGSRIQRGFDSATYHNMLDAAGFARPAAADQTGKR